jgi:hypothetical protein
MIGAEVPMEMPKVRGVVGERVRFDEGTARDARGRIVEVLDPAPGDSGRRVTVEQDPSCPIFSGGSVVPVLRWTADVADLAQWPHELKTDPEPFALVLAGVKRFEVRRADRDYQAGDLVVLAEHRRDAQPDVEPYTGREALVRIAHLLVGPPYLPEGLCVFGIDMLRPGAARDADTSEGASMITRGARRVTYGERGLDVTAEHRTDGTWLFEVTAKILPGRLLLTVANRDQAEGAMRALEGVLGRITTSMERTASALDHVRRYAMGHLPQGEIDALRRIVEQVIHDPGRGEVRTGDVLEGPDGERSTRSFLRLVVNTDGELENGGTVEVQDYIRAPWGPSWWSSHTTDLWRRIARFDGEGGA